MLADLMISGEWIIAFCVAVIGAIGGVYVKARKDGLKSAESREVTLKEPVPPLEVGRKYSPPTFHQHMALEKRVSAMENDVRELRRDLAAQFNRLLEVGEERKDKIMASIESMTVGFHQRVNQIVSEMNRNDNKPPRR